MDMFYQFPIYNFSSTVYTVIILLVMHEAIPHQFGIIIHKRIIYLRVKNIQNTMYMTRKGVWSPEPESKARE